ARLEAARTDMTEARPGDQIMVETVIRPYRGERLVRQIPIRIPTSTSKGTLRILVSDGDTLDRMHRGTPMMNRGLGLAPTIALLNKERANDRVYVSLIGSDPEAMVADKVMPTLPLSVMNSWKTCAAHRTWSCSANRRSAKLPPTRSTMS